MFGLRNKKNDFHLLAYTFLSGSLIDTVYTLKYLDSLVCANNANSDQTQCYIPLLLFFD